MVQTFDVAVVGSGIAGVAAALAARRRGVTVAVIARGPAASALGCGGWIGSAPEPLIAALEQAGYTLTQPADALPHPDGSLRRFDFAASSHARGIRDGDTIVGIVGLPAFHAKTLARIYAEATGWTLRHAEMLLPDTPDSGWSPVSLAAHIDRDPSSIISALRELDTDSGFVLPAVLGFSTVTHQAIESAVDRSIIEALGVPPSVPGWRLHTALQRCLQEANVAMFAGSVTGNHRSGSVLNALQIGEQRVEAREFVLATGKFLGGGVAATPDFVEPVLDLPVFIDNLGERFTRTMPLALTVPQRDQHQLLLQAGVRTDAHGLPIDHADQPIFTNVFLAGTIKAGVDANFGLGEAAQDGWRAGERAVR